MPTGDIETYRQSIERPEEFWAEAAEAIDWERRRDRVLGDSRSPFLSLVRGWAAQHLLESARLHHARDRRRRDLPVAGDDRRSRGIGRNRQGFGNSRLR